MLSYLEISRSNLLHNFDLFRSLIHPNTKIVAAIKGNAYGHGQNEVAQISEDRADYFQVDDIEELHLLRHVNNKPTLVLGYVPKADLAEAVSLGGELTIYDIDRVKQLNAIGQQTGIKPKVHIKIDAYWGRQGVLLRDLADFLRQLKLFNDVEVVGAYSHFANMDNANDFTRANHQLDNFHRALMIFIQHGYKDIQTHISNTAGSLLYERTSGINSFVRIGLGLYGMWPSSAVKEKLANDQFQLRPVMRWVTHIAQIKTVPKDYPIGYDMTYVTEREMKVAVIPQGYSDGYDRGLSNCGEVLIQGTRCRVLGRISMNMFVVDVYHIANVQAEDEVVLLGKQGDEEITAEEIAQKIGTINYEVTTRISPLLPRIVV